MLKDKFFVLSKKVVGNKNILTPTLYKPWRARVITLCVRDLPAGRLSTSVACMK